jgi:hypothetical protein
MLKWWLREVGYTLNLVTVHHYGGDVFVNPSIEDLLSEKEMVRVWKVPFANPQGRTKHGCTKQGLCMRGLAGAALPHAQVHLGSRQRTCLVPIYQCLRLRTVRACPQTLRALLSCPLYSPPKTYFMPNLRELVKISKENGLPLRVTEAATLSYGGVQVRARGGGGPVAQAQGGTQIEAG